MKQKQVVPIIIIAGVVTVAAATGIYFLANPAAWQKVAVQMDLTQPKTNGLTASGFIEAEEAANAYIAGLEARAKQDKSLNHVASVASFFLSRIDVLADST